MSIISHFFTIYIYINILLFADFTCVNNNTIMGYSVILYVYSLKLDNIFL